MVRLVRCYVGQLGVSSVVWARRRNWNREIWVWGGRVPRLMTRWWVHVLREDFLRQTRGCRLSRLQGRVFLMLNRVLVRATGLQIGLRLCSSFLSLLVV